MSQLGLEILYEEGPCLVVNKPGGVLTQAPPGIDSVERRIINVSSGAAQTALAGGAVYGISKAAIEMLTASLAADHTAPGFRAITLRPGIFETGMQQFMRSHDRETFPSVDLFREFKDRGILKDPGEVAARVVERLVEGPVDHGRTYSHVDLQY